MTTIKSTYRLATISLYLFFIFWIAETVFFLIRDGWHWKAIMPDEKACDTIANFLLSISLLFFLWSTGILVKMFASLDTIKIHSFDSTIEEVEDKAPFIHGMRVCGITVPTKSGVMEEEASGGDYGLTLFLEKVDCGDSHIWYIVIYNINGVEMRRYSAAHCIQIRFYN